MDLKTFLKTTEAIVVLIGIFLTLSLGKFWAIATAVAYIFLNVPNLWNTVSQWINRKL